MTDADRKRSAGTGGTGVADSSLPRRFYTHVTVGQSETGDWAVLLDDRPARTPGKRPFAFPTHALAGAIAEEWETQGDKIDPSTMPMTRIANSVIDGVAVRMREVRAEIVKYAASDLVCYRAERPEELARLQSQHWDRVLSWAREHLGADFILAAGVMPVEQAPETLERIARAISELEPMPLGALHVMTTLTGSALIALAHAHGILDLDEAWAAAHVDEDYQISKWGEDAEAMEKRTQRRLEMRAASQLDRLAREV